MLEHEHEKPVRLLFLKLACTLASLPVKGRSFHDLPDHERERIRRWPVEVMERDRLANLKVAPTNRRLKFTRKALLKSLDAHNPLTLSVGPNETGMAVILLPFADLMRRPTDAQLDRLCKELHVLLGQLTNPNLGWALLSGIRVDIEVFTKHGHLTSRRKGGFRSVFLPYTVQVLEEFGVDSVRRCAHCECFFVGPKGKMFCERRCVEADKLRRYKSTDSKSADYNEDHAVRMWKKRYKSKREQARIEERIKTYREKREKRGLQVSNRPVAEVAKRYA